MISGTDNQIRLLARIWRSTRPSCSAQSWPSKLCGTRSDWKRPFVISPERIIFSIASFRSQIPIPWVFSPSLATHGGY